MVKTGWEKDMEKLYKETAKNWKRTGNVKKSSGINGNVNLGQGKKESRGQKKVS